MLAMADTVERVQHTSNTIVLDLTKGNSIRNADEARFGESESGFNDRIDGSAFGEVAKSLSNTNNISLQHTSGEAAVNPSVSRKKESEIDAHGATEVR